MSTNPGSPFARPSAPTTNPAEPRPKAASGGIGDATQPPPLASQPIDLQPLRRLSQPQLVTLADRLPDRERQIVQAVEMFRLLRADQIRRLFFHEITTTNGSARVCRRSLARLTDTGLIRRLDRRVGGVGGGGSGNAYAVTAAGRRLMAYWGGSGLGSDRGVHEPGAGFVEHTLAIAELYVTLIEADRDRQLELLAFDAEPTCWRTYTTPFAATVIVKPDALVRVAAGEYEHVSFVEIDRATQGRGALLRKINTYVAYYKTGREQTATGVFPQVIWITTTAARARFLTELIAGLPADGRRLFAVTTTAGALTRLKGNDAATENGAER